MKKKVYSESCEFYVVADGASSGRGMREKKKVRRFGRGDVF